MEKIQSLIENSNSFGIITDKNPEDHEFLIKELLKNAINNRGLPTLILPDKHEELEKKWSSLTNTFLSQPIEFPKKTSIKIPKQKYKVKEVSYQNEKDNLVLLITGGNNILTANDLQLEVLPSEAEAIFCLFEDPEKLNYYQNKIQLPAPEKRIFLTPNNKTITEKTFELIKIINPNLLEKEEINTAFFAALITETNNFSEKTTKDTLALASQLLEKGAQKEIITRILDQEKKTPFIQLSGRTLARTYINEQTKISWSFLNEKDVQKTNNAPLSPILSYQLLKKIKGLLPRLNTHILSWQSAHEVYSTIMSGEGKDKNHLLSLAKKLNVKTQNPFFVTGPFESFSRAEVHIKQALREHNLIEKETKLE